MNRVKGTLMAAILIAIALTLFACSVDYEGELNGVWDRGDIVVTIDGSNGRFTQINSGGWLPILNNGSISIGDRKFRNISQTDDFKWTGQELCQDLSWHDTTITMDNDGQTIRSTTTNCTGDGTYTRKE